MKPRMIFLAVVFLLLNTAFSHVYATSEIKGNVSNTTAMLSAKNIIKGRLGGQQRQETWHYDNQYDGNGNLTEYSETVLVYEFHIDEELVGGLETTTIELYIPQHLMEQYEKDDAKHDFLEGKSVIIGVSPDSGAHKRGNIGFNISHGEQYSAQTDEEVRTLKEWITELYEKQPDAIDSQLEAAYGHLGTGDDLNLETPKQQQDHPHVTHPETTISPVAGSNTQSQPPLVAAEENTSTISQLHTQNTESAKHNGLNVATIIVVFLSVLCVGFLLRGFLQSRNNNRHS